MSRRVGKAREFRLQRRTVHPLGDNYHRRVVFAIRLGLVTWISVMQNGRLENVEETQSTGAT
jgi:hypothetical protein